MSIGLDMSSLAGDTIFVDDEYHFYYLENKLYVNDRKKFKSLIIGSFCIVVNSHIINVDEEEVVDEFYEFTIYTTNYSFPASVKAAEASKFNWIQRCSGSRISFGPGRSYFPHYISFLLSQNNYHYIRNYVRGGWKQYSNQWIYVTSTECISSQLLNEGYKSLNNGQFNLIDIDERTIFECSMNAFNLCKNPESITPLWLYVQLGFFSSLFEYANFPTRFVLAYLGKSNTKKTSIVNVLTSILGNYDNYKPLLNFKSTQGGVEKMISEYQDCCITIDDLHPTTNKIQKDKMMAILESVIRLIGDGIPPHRMNTKRIHNPKVGVIITGEEELEQVYSSKTRVFTVHTNAEQCNLEILSYFQDNPCILSTYLHNLIKWVCNNTEDVLNIISTNMNSGRLKYRDIFPVPRLCDNAVQLMIMASIICRYAYSIGYFSHEKGKDLFNRCINSVLNVAKANLITMQKQNNDHIIDAFKCFWLKEKGILLNGNMQNETDCFVARNILHVSTEIFQNIIDDYFSEIGIVDIHTQRQIREHLYKENILLKIKEGDKQRYSIKIGKTNKRFCKLNIAELENC